MRDFRLYWLGQAGSTFGTVFTATATGLVAVQVLGATPTQSGLLGAAASLPTLVLGLLAGVLADRIVRPRRALVAADLAGMLTLGTVALGFWLGWADVWWLVALNIVLGALSLTVETVYFLHLRGIVAAEELVTARARLQAGEYSAGVLGRALAGPVVAVTGGFGAFLVDAVSYLVSLATLLGLRTPDRPRERPRGPDGRGPGLRAEIGQGIRAVTGDRFLGPLVGYLAVQALALGAVTALTAQFLVRVVRVPTPLYGLLFVLVGLAGLAGSLAGARLARRLPLRRLTVLAFAGTALAPVLLPAAGGPLPTAMALAAAGIGLPVFFGALANVGLTGVITGEVPEDVLGRAVTTIQTLVTSAQLTGAVAGGVLGSRIGIHPALWAAALAGVASLVLAVPALRAGRQQPGAPAGPPAPAADPPTGMAPTAPEPEPAHR